MVNIAFICEDDAGKKIIESADFAQILQQNKVRLVSPVFNAKGKGNLTEENVRGLVNSALDNGATHIFLLTDMDLDACITITRQKLIQDPVCQIIVCKKAVEAWFLADSGAMSSLLNRKEHIEFPESPDIPFDTINQLHRDAFNGRGISKAILPIKMIRNAGFSITHAANHPNCPSASYFLQKLQFLTRAYPMQFSDTRGK
jgi:hypothetical protein